AAGLLTKPETNDPGSVPGIQRPGDGSDEDALAFVDTDENKEINRIRYEAYTRLGRKLAPVFEPHSFDRVLQLTKHSNPVCRSQAMALLGSFGFHGRDLPFSNDAEAVKQL